MNESDFSADTQQAKLVRLQAGWYSPKLQSNHQPSILPELLSILSILILAYLMGWV